ncbi:MAG: hypothetical protein U9R21_08920, partial [Candidatus Thermoplasmatota archaeon]|nr:hypothetical protein [Candidatus Thermoplasmatota archaeon]
FGESMEIDGEHLQINKIKFELNRKTLMLILVVIGLSIVISGWLSYVFSDSVITVLCSLVIGATIGVLLNYFIISSHEIFKKVNIETSKKGDAGEIHTVMKIE